MVVRSADHCPTDELESNRRKEMEGMAGSDGDRATVQAAAAAAAISDID